MLFHLPHLEDRDMHSNLGTEVNGYEENANSSQEEEKEWPRNVRKKKAKLNFLREGTTADFVTKKKCTIQM
jgi:hypothetical protein